MRIRKKNERIGKKIYQGKEIEHDKCMEVEKIDTTLKRMIRFGEVEIVETEPNPFKKKETEPIKEPEPEKKRAGRPAGNKR